MATVDTPRPDPSLGHDQTPGRPVRPRHPRRPGPASKLFIRNYTYLPPSLEGDESEGPPHASTRASSRRLCTPKLPAGRDRRPQFLAPPGMCGSNCSTSGRRSVDCRRRDDGGHPVRSPVVVGDRRSVPSLRPLGGGLCGTHDFGRKVGFAPFIVRPRRLSPTRGRRPADVHLAGVQPRRRQMKPGYVVPHAQRQDSRPLRPY
jgi:hypothetical protein